MTDHISLSVRQLVEYAYRSGSIENRFRTANTMTEGTKAHQRVQKTYNEGDQKEVFLKLTMPYEGLLFNIEGRCDGILFEKGDIVIDEIKSTLRPLDDLEEESYPVHWAQAKCYAYMYAVVNQIRKMTIQLRYVNLEEDEQKCFRQIWELEDLEDFFLEMISRYAPFAILMGEHLAERNESIQALPFPFKNYREGQRRLAGSVYKTIQEGRTLFANAPTGIGKTMSTAYPTVKAIGEGHLDRFFYLTAKSITRTAAEEAFSLMKNNGLKLNAVTLTAKEKTCFKDKMICDKEYCEFANGYYDRLNDSLHDLFSNEHFIDRHTLETYARKHTLCPFELSLDAAYLADAIICDYNYVFDPRVSLKRFFEEQKKKTALLIDEAHNLVDRARDMFSAAIKQTSFYSLERLYRNKNDALYKASRKINDVFLAAKKKMDTQGVVMEELPQDLIGDLEAFSEVAELELVRPSFSEDQEPLLDAYFAAHSFIRLSKLYDKRYVTLVESINGDAQIRLFCIDPSHQLQEISKGFRSKIFFSATLLPFQYYLDMLGKAEEDYTLTLQSPFPKENSAVWIQPLSTRYRDRDQTKQGIVRMIKATIEAHPGNYLVFSPSYQYMDDLYDSFCQVKGKIETILQNPLMAEEEREDFLAHFQPRKTSSFVGFSILGGLFSEGIDLKGDRLNGVIVVGVGLPQIGLENDVIKNYFAKLGKNGFDYAYVYPGLNKVVQAGGRLIRSETDSGIIVLVDDRFLTPNYKRLLPYEWQDFQIIR